jgi:hypothetical protein
MTSKEPKDFVSSLKRKWIWVLVPIIALGIIYTIYISYNKEPDIEYAQATNQDYFKTIPIRKFTPLREYFLNIAKTIADFKPNIVSDYRKLNLDTIPAQMAVVNLGVYAADIGYLSAYDRTQEALKYMDVCLELSKAVNGWDMNNSDVLGRFERNLSNPDSSVQILNQFNNNVIRFSLEHEHRDLGLLMVFGAFIESQYITTQIIKDFPEDMLQDDLRWRVLSPLISIVIDQKEFLRRLIEELEGLEGKEEWEIATFNYASLFTRRSLKYKGNHRFHLLRTLHRTH